MIDRTARDELAAAIETYLDDRSTAFQFDEQISEIAGRTSDGTVQKFAFELWCHYDDCTDHRVILSKAQWGFFQRLLLVLRSDAEWHERTHRVWKWKHAVAGALFAGFIAVALATGFGWHLFIVSIPFGLLSMALSHYSSEKTGDADIERTRIAPFRTFADLRTTRSAQASFRKRRFPSQIARRRIRSPLLDKLYTVQARILWLLCAPAVLLFQMIPVVEGEGWVEVVQPPHHQLSREFAPLS
ncbi:MAG: hypothetical protein IPM18_12425 [Phycisphaerales bacterium]|nr:hypothetical protein [Phycisphaerales bacterium]